MKLLLLLAIVVIVALAVYMAARAIHYIFPPSNKWTPDVIEHEDGSQDIVLTRGPNTRQVVIHEIPAGLNPLEATAERNIGWDEAEIQAEKWNK